MGSSLIPVSIRVGLGHGAGVAENCPVWKKAHTSGVRNAVSVTVVGTQRRHTGYRKQRGRRPRREHVWGPAPGERRGPAPSPTLHLPSLPLTPSFRTSSRSPCPQLTPTPCVQQATGLLVHPLLLQAAQTRRSIPTPHAGPSSALLVVPAVSFLHLPPPSPSFSHSMKIMEKKVRNTGRKRGGEMESVSGSYQE